MTATSFQYFACLLTLCQFALVSTNTLNISLHDGNPKDAPLTQGNMREINKFNELEKGTATYGVTKFADLTEKEFQKSFNGLTLKPDSKISHALPMADIPDVALPESFDWRDHNAVTPVRQQGHCGSCWAFSVTGQIESLYAIKNGALSWLSPQQLMDCNRYRRGCEGGDFILAYVAIEEMGGLELDSDYTYIARRQACTLDKRRAKVKISSFKIIESNETSMAKWIVQNGPLSAAVNAEMMRSYVGGISRPDQLHCDPANVTHAIIIVGFGVERDSSNDTTPYWIIKNSHGLEFGEHGYYRLYRGDNACGITTLVTTAVLGDPPSGTSHANGLFETYQYVLTILLTILSIVNIF